jgi:iron complex transport system permease protein
LLVAIFLAVMLGAVTIPAGETLNILLHRAGLASVAGSWSPADDSIIWSIRLPRVLAAALVGGGLATAGALFQAVLRNPLADPYVIGTSAGAQLGVTLAVLSPVQFALAGFGPLQLGAFTGALVTVLFVYWLARTAGRTPIVTLLLAGFVVSSFLISATSFLALTNHRMDDVLSWTMGSVSVSQWKQLAVAAPLMVFATLTCFLFARRLDVMQLGEDQATHLGIRVERLKVSVIVLASLLTALAVTLAGVVAFVGLIVPHAVRMIYGPSHRILLPASALGGALFVVVVDLAARTISAPAEIPLGIMTAVAGAPFFLHLLRRSRSTYGA